MLVLGYARTYHRVAEAGRDKLGVSGLGNLVMRNPEIEYFSITEIFCKDWQRGTGVAGVWAGNYVGDSLSFSIAWHPDNQMIMYNLELDFFSPELSPFMAEEIVNGQLIQQAEASLDDWWVKITELREALNPKVWNPAPGSRIEDGYYALLAILYEIRKPFSSNYIIECMSTDVEASVAATKQRVRRARELGYLTSPGKGLVGQGKVTQKATNLVRRERLL